MSRQLNNYVRAILPDPYRILGVKLRPYSLGSYFLMQRFDVAFVSEDSNKEGGVPDLLLAIAICSRTFEEFLEFINDEEEFYKWSRDWGKQVEKMMKKDKDFNMLYKFMDFEKYMKDGITIPKYFEGEQAEEGSVSGAHWTHSVLSVLTANLGYTHSEALNMSLSKALADYFKWCESQGMVHLMTDDELEIVEGMETAQAA